MSSAHETQEHLHHAEHAHHAPSNKKVAILIVALAAFLAIMEMGGKSAQTTALNQNIEAANLWNFFQAKTIRMTVMRTAAEGLDAEGGEGLAPEKAERLAKRAAQWKETAARYDSEPSTNEGRKELMARAKAAEAVRDKALGAYHLFEYASAALQLAIVLASASVITEMALLAFVGAGLGGVGLILGLIGWFAPTLIHL
ncbi:MAG: DUF4337 domain-containing protein [Rhodospirillales bacterium]|nr:DUF4337 domain-containing protein [Rhodospirillales bacterium]